MFNPNIDLRYNLFYNHEFSGVCTNIIHLTQNKLKNYTGNYDTFIRTRGELEENQMKQYKWEQDQMAHMKDYVIFQFSNRLTNAIICYSIYRLLALAMVRQNWLARRKVRKRLWPKW